MASPVLHAVRVGLRSRCLVVACASMTLLAASWASAEPRTAETEFLRLSPCPVHDARDGECPGYTIVHVVPLCLGGPDVAYNMRWQRLADLGRADMAGLRQCQAPTPNTPPPIAEEPSRRT